MAVKYTQEVGKNRACAMGPHLPISTKISMEICSFLRGKKVDMAKQILENVMEKKQAIPFKRFNWDMGHKPGMAAGRYPKKASQEILTIIKSAESNATFKGLSTKDLIIKYIVAKQGGKQYRFGRLRGRKAKRTHIEVIVEEVKK